MVVISIIASVAVANYQGYVDRAAMLQDETNLMVLQTAVKINAMETGVVAGNLSELHPADLEKAYASFIQGKRPYTLLAYLQERWQSLWDSSVAEAGIIAPYYNRDLRMVTCRRDPIPPTVNANGRDVDNPSYAISRKMRGKTVQYMLARPDSTLLYEVDKTRIGEREHYRHRNNRSVRVRASGRTRRKTKDDPNEDDDHPDDGD